MFPAMARRVGISSLIWLVGLAALCVSLLLAAGAEASEPDWSYDAGDNVDSVAVSTDGAYLAAGTVGWEHDINRAYLFDRNSSTPLWYRDAGDKVWAVAISADGEYIAAGAEDKKVYLFHRNSSTPLWSYTTGGSVGAVAISADGEYIVAGSDDHYIYLFRKSSSSPIWSYEAFYSVASVAISADGEYIVAGTWATELYLFDKDSSSPLWGDFVDGWVLSVAISEHGDYIAAGTGYTEEDGNKTMLYQKQSSTPLWEHIHEDWVRSVSISADGDYIVSGSWDYKVYLFEKASGTPEWDYVTGEEVQSVAISADGEYIVAGSLDDKIYYFDRTSSDPLWDYDTGGSVTSVSISGDGRIVGAGNTEDQVLLFDTNIAPVATIDSVTPALAEQGEEVSFQGHGTDEDGSITDYLWQSDIDGNLSYEASFSDDSLSLGTHTITFKVKDDADTWSQEATFSLTVTFFPNATIDSIDPNATDEGEQISFQGSGTDEDGSIVAYAWRSDRDGGLSTAASFSTTTLSPGDHTIYFRVQDNAGAWSEEVSQNLHINNTLPTAAIDSISPSPAHESDLITFRGSGSDPQGGITAYQWRSDIDGVFGSTSQFSYNGLSPGDHTISLKVRDNENTWSEEVSLLLHLNARPTASIISIAPALPDEGESVTFNGSGTDDDGTVSGYQWRSSSDDILSTEKFFTTSSLSAGVHTIYLAVQDNEGAWSPEIQQSLTVNYLPVATIESVAPSPADVDEIVTFNGSGTDADGTIAGYAWRLGNGTQLSTASFFSTSSLSAGNHTILFKVQDNRGAWSPEVSVDVRINIPPTATIEAIVPLTTSEGEVVNFTGNGSDADGTVTAYRWLSDIVGLIGTEISFTMTTLTPANHSISFRVRDDDGSWSEDAWGQLLVLNRLPEAMIDSILPLSANLGDNISFAGRGTDALGAIAAYRWVSSRDGPFGTTANFTYNALSPGDHLITLTVQDDEGSWSEPTSVLIYINDRPVAAIVSITPSPALQGAPVAFNGTADDSDGDIIGYEWLSDRDGPLSSQASFIASNLSLGTHNITFRARDNASLWSTLAWWILEVVVPIQNQLPSASLSASFPSKVIEGATVTLSGSGDDRDGEIVAYAWDSSIDGPLGASASLALSNLSVGTHTITFRVKDNNGTWSEPVSTTLIVEAEVTADDGDRLPALGTPVWIAIIAGVVVLGGAGAGLFWWRARSGAMLPPRPPGAVSPAPASPLPGPSPSTPEMTAIECPACQARMHVPKLSLLQQVRCDTCGLEGEIEV